MNCIKSDITGLRIDAEGLKWRGKGDELPHRWDITLTDQQALASGYMSVNRETMNYVLDMGRVRELVVKRISAEYGKKPSNKFWIYVGFKH